MVVRRDDVYVPLVRNTVEMWLLGLCVLSGAQSWHTRVAHLPAWAGWVWYGLLIGGGLLGVAGGVWPDAITGILVLRAAWLVIGFGAYGWTVALLAVHSAQPVAAIVTATFGAAAHGRVVQISRYVRTNQGRRRSP